ncbi:nitroreductase family protein [Parapedobacter tibetensis]|uniref:nitroreductase family protein n=1 Tax=Parapedobacter tibetensis TaxID=2972951 RepID=UPI00214D8568|nr:nitroreductase family protein [Parapedobacter tibetensis]
MLKRIIKAVLPSKLYHLVLRSYSSFRVRQKIKQAFLYDYRRYLKASGSFGGNTSIQLIGNIIREYHSVEKGLTLPQTRLGFGKRAVLILINDLIKHVKNYGGQDEQVRHGIQVVLEYEYFHEYHGFKIDQEVEGAIRDLKQYVNDLQHSVQLGLTKAEYFKYKDASFDLFSHSRASVRTFDDTDISVEKILRACSMARNAPSACNRQSWKAYVFSDKEKINKILRIQGGNRGFGHLTNKLIVIAAEIGVFVGAHERNQAYIDGGIYAMNLLYSLHYQEIGACILNCSNGIEKDRTLRDLCKIQDSEVFIAMIVCGNLPESFKVPISKRYSEEHFIVFKD